MDLSAAQPPLQRSRRRLALRAVAVLAGVWLALNVIVGYVSAHPGLTELIWDSPQDGAFAETVGGKLVETDTVRGRFVPASTEGAGSIVLVHGYNGSIDSEPLVELARQLRDRGYGILAIELGYRDGRHRYSGGHREANDISAAIDWLHRHQEPVTAVWGFSAGAHAALIAATQDPDVPAVVADSPFADAGAQIQRSAGDTTHLPASVFALMPTIVDMFSGDHPVSLLDLDWPGTPTLVIGGLHDDTVPPRDPNEIAEHTRGRLVSLPVDHTRGILTATDLYLQHALEFLDKLPPPGDRPRGPG